MYWPTTLSVKKFVASFSIAVTFVNLFVDLIAYMAKYTGLAKRNAKEFLFVDILVVVSVASHACHVKDKDV